jgi:hypothetical protein
MKAPARCWRFYGRVLRGDRSSAPHRCDLRQRCARTVRGNARLCYARCVCANAAVSTVLSVAGTTAFVSNATKIAVGGARLGQRRREIGRAALLKRGWSRRRCTSRDRLCRNVSVRARKGTSAWAQRSFQRTPGAGLALSAGFALALTIVALQSRTFLHFVEVPPEGQVLNVRRERRVACERRADRVSYRPLRTSRARAADPWRSVARKLVGGVQIPDAASGGAIDRDRARRRSVPQSGTCRAHRAHPFHHPALGSPGKSRARNLGVDHWTIEVALRQALDDMRYWAEHNTYLPDEIAVRFHHKLVAKTADAGDMALLLTFART